MRISQVFLAGRDAVKLSFSLVKTLTNLTDQLLMTGPAPFPPFQEFDK